jgi:respiratory burst oxidase
MATWYDNDSFDRLNDHLEDPARMSGEEQFPPLRDDAVANPRNDASEALRRWNATGAALTVKQFNAVKAAINAVGGRSLSRQDFARSVGEQEDMQGPLLTGEQRIGKDLCHALFDALDVNKDGCLDADEAKLALSVFTAGDADTAMMRLFQEQAKGRGVLVREDVEAMMRRNIQTVRTAPIEEAQVSAIRASFEKVAVDGKLDREAFGKALGLGDSDEKVKEHIFMAFDQNRDGTIDFEEFVDAVKSLNDKSVGTDQRLLLAFKAEDTDNSGEIDAEELKRILSASYIKEGKLELSEEQFQKMADALMWKADTDKSGSINFEEFASVIKTHPEAGRSVGLGEGHLMTLPKSQADVAKQRARAEKQGPGCWKSLVTAFSGWTTWDISVVVIYCLGMGWLIFSRCSEYDYGDPVHQLFAPMAYCAARGSAAAIMFSGIWVLFPMCRTFMTWLRNNGPRTFPWDSAIEFHKMAAIITLVMTLIHIAGHIHNYKMIMDADWETIAPILGPKSWCHTDPQFHTRCGSGAFDHKPTFGEVLATGPTLTGILLTLIFMIAYPMCAEWPRSKVLQCYRHFFPSESKKEGTFNIFWYTHHLFLVYLVVLCIHGAWAWLRKPSAYKYVLPSLVIYTIEKLLRGCNLRWMDRGESFCSWLKSVFVRRPAPVRHAAQHKQSKALELWVRKPEKMKYLAGQYCFIQVPSINKFEWHPFTLTSAPHEDCLKFHIAAVGDWTTELYNMFPKGWDSELNEAIVDWDETRLKISEDLDEATKQKMEGLADCLLPARSIYIDGPYGAPAQDFTKYKVSMLIGAGIGVTPFAAVLRDLLHLFSTWRDMRDPLQGLKEMSKGAAALPMDFQLEKIYFHWSTRSQKSLSWFSEIMEDILSRDESGMLQIFNWLTSAKMNSNTATDLFDIAKDAANERGDDVVSGLSKGMRTLSHGSGHKSAVITKFARPDYRAEMIKLKEMYPGIKIGVFFCGPPVIRAQLEEACRELSGKRGSGETRFKLHAENF